jgi:hypothetical protein
MATPAERFVAAAREDLGLGEPNHIQKWYLREIDKSLGDWNWAWCNAAVTYWAYKAGVEKAVIVGTAKGYAYTVFHAQAFQKAKRWYTGTVENLKRAQPGDIIFFDWGGTNSVGAIDHVGVVEKNLGGGRVQTIEGNTSDKCLRRVRDASTVAGFGRPDWAKAGAAPKPSKPATPKPAPKPSKAPAFPGPVLQYPPMRKTETARKWQEQMRKRGWDIAVDGWYGPASKTVCRNFQGEKGLSVDGLVGPNTWRMAWEAPIT